MDWVTHRYTWRTVIEHRDQQIEHQHDGSEHIDGVEDQKEHQVQL